MTTKRRTRARVKPVEVSSEPAVPITEVAPIPAVPTVCVSSLQVGDQFEYGGERYRRLSLVAGKVTALHLTNPEKGWIGITQTAFDPSTLVIKK